MTEGKSELTDLRAILDRLPGEWTIDDRYAKAAVAVRAEDELKLRFRLLDDDFLGVEPILPGTDIRTPDQSDWHDIHGGAMPKPARLNLSLGVEHVAAKLANGLLVEAEELHRVVQEVVRIEASPASHVDRMSAVVRGSGIGRELPSFADGVERKFRLHGPFAGEIKIRRTGTAHILLQEVPLALAAKLMEILPGLARDFEPKPLPRYTPPAGASRRGPKTSVTGSTRAAVLEALRHNPDMKQRDLARHFGISPQAVSAHVNALRKAGEIGGDVSPGEPEGAGST